jgi:hypothetical protein
MAFDLHWNGKLHLSTFVVVLGGRKMEWIHLSRGKSNKFIEFSKCIDHNSILNAFFFFFFFPVLCCCKTGMNISDKIFIKFRPEKYEFMLYKGCFMERMARICQIWMIPPRAVEVYMPNFYPPNTGNY